jgi:hypothetical protein
VFGAAIFCGAFQSSAVFQSGMRQVSALLSLLATHCARSAASSAIAWQRSALATSGSALMVFVLCVHASVHSSYDSCFHSLHSLTAARGSASPTVLLQCRSP